jgi:hypothetical protein
METSDADIPYAVPEYRTDGEKNAGTDPRIQANICECQRDHLSHRH